MNNEIKKYIKDLAINKLMDSELGNKIEVGINLFEKIQENLNALSEKEGDELNTATKIYTIMTFAILKKYTMGKNPLEFSKEDWKEIATEISDYAIIMDNQQYVVFVFNMYENYIRSSVKHLSEYIGDEMVISIEFLADDISKKTAILQNGEIAEARYIEDCLWICLEAMIKLLASASKIVLKDEYGELSQALASYAFEYGRFVLFRQEQQLINQFIEEQCTLDNELQNKYEKYVQNLEKEANYFYTLIDNAFVPNFREQFLHSIVLAEAAGVKESEILMSVSDIDDFFMN